MGNSFEYIPLLNYSSLTEVKQGRKNISYYKHNTIRDIIIKHMNYELAKELKDAGFPFTKVWEGFEGNHPELFETDFLLPTLDELIEACGDRFDNLLRIEDTWIARGYNYPLEKSKTPKEAVARLWSWQSKRQRT